ncbi:MAG: T9SS type A sorting domain-containing protein, partial [Chitinophagaceae bacterium]
PFKFIDGSNAVQDNYTARQFMEFSVNLSKLGLDPITLLGGDACGLPFRRILVKSRSSTSFTSELKDFIGPFDFFKTAPVEALTDVPLYCGPLGVSELMVMNPLPSSVYTWSTPDGRFVYDPVGNNVTADMPGTYIVKQQLLDGCSSQSTDTVVITHDATCVPMQNGATGFRGQLVQQQARLYWNADAKEGSSFILQRSTDGKNFGNVAVVAAGNSTSYSYPDDIQQITHPFIYYRLVTRSASGQVQYSTIIRLQKSAASPTALVYPNPATTQLQVHLPAERSKKVTLTVYTVGGSQVHTAAYSLAKGANTITIEEVARWQPGLYLLAINDENNQQWLKFMVSGSGAAAARPY